MKPETYWKVTGIIFLVIAVLHGLRVLLGWQAVIGGWLVPMWPSAIAVVVAGYLAYQGLRSCGR